MDSEDALIRQVEATQRANPGLRQLVYRNSVHAMPWYKTVLEKLQDERYSGFFLRFGATAPLPNGSYYSPPCDTTYDPVRSHPSEIGIDQALGHHLRLLGRHLEALQDAAAVGAQRVRGDQRHLPHGVSSEPRPRG